MLSIILYILLFATSIFIIVSWGAPIIHNISKDISRLCTPCKGNTDPLVIVPMIPSYIKITTLFGLSLILSFSGIFSQFTKITYSPTLAVLAFLLATDIIIVIIRMVVTSDVVKPTQAEKDTGITEDSIRERPLSMMYSGMCGSLLILLSAFFYFLFIIPISSVNFSFVQDMSSHDITETNHILMLIGAYYGELLVLVLPIEMFISRRAPTIKTPLMKWLNAIDNKKGEFIAFTIVVLPFLPFILPMYGNLFMLFCIFVIYPAYRCDYVNGKINQSMTKVQKCKSILSYLIKYLVCITACMVGGIFVIVGNVMQFPALLISGIILLMISFRIPVDDGL